MIVEVTIGWTKPNRATGYSNFDGYQPGAEQHVEKIEVEFTDEEMAAYGKEPFPHFVAEWVFEATNDRPSEGRVAYRFRKAIDATGYRGQGAHFSLSTGDTVTVGETMLACENVGWRTVRSIA